LRDMVVRANFGDPNRSRPLSIEDILHARPQQPEATTRGRGWGGVTLDVHRPYFKCAESYSALDHHLICYCPAGSSRLIQGRAGTLHDSVISTGMSYIMPAGYDSTWEGDSGQSARLRIPTPLIALAAEQLGQRSTSQVEIRNVFETRDLVIERLALTLLAEISLRPHPAQTLIVDAVSTALAAHMLRCYDAFEVFEHNKQARLGRKELARLIAYIEDNLDRTIGLAELAELANVSRFHFTRLFKRSTGYTAIGFVELCRIRRAQALISETDHALAQVALMTGFADQSHFTRRFRYHVGCTPAAFAREHGNRRSVRRLSA
jgi:AraC family transcriptional regulator